MGCGGREGRSPKLGVVSGEPPPSCADGCPVRRNESASEAFAVGKASPEAVGSPEPVPSELRSTGSGVGGNELSFRNSKNASYFALKTQRVLRPRVWGLLWQRQLRRQQEGVPVP